MGTADNAAAPKKGADDRPPSDALSAPSSLVSGALQEELRAKVSVAYAPLVALYQLFDARLREKAADGPAPIGWTPHIKALRALRDGHVHGQWERLARLMVDPGSLTAVPRQDQDHSADDTAAVASDDTAAVASDVGRREAVTAEAVTAESVQAVVERSHVCLIQASAGADRTAVVGEIVRRRAATGARTLLLTPTADTAEDVLAGIGDEPEIFMVQVGPVHDADRTDPPRPEERAPAGLVRAIGTAYQKAWKAEIRELRRNLLWLEQWPRDQDTLAAVRAEHERRCELLSAGEDRLVGQVRERRAMVMAAEQEAVAAREAHDRLGEEHRRAVDADARARAEWADLQAFADLAAETAAERTRVAEASHARYRALDERFTHCRQELQAARQREEWLIEELDRTHQALPEASAEAERLSTIAAEAAATDHASYYRRVAAESALTAERRRLSWGQRMRVTTTHPEIQRLRRQLADLKGEAGEAAAQARRAGEAFQKAEEHRAGLAAFLSSGGEELVAVRAAQERLGEEIAGVSAERDVARSEHLERARQVPEAVEQATRASDAARYAHYLGRQAEERSTMARLAHEEAITATDHALAEAQAAARRLAGSEAELERRREQAAAEIAASLAETETAAQAEARSRQHVRDICGGDPAGARKDLLAGHRTHAMARIEQLSASMELLREPVRTGERGESLLKTAVLVCGTALDVATTPLLAATEFDTLIVDDAGRFTDSEFLIGAVKARRWILIGDGHGLPPRARDEHDEYEDHIQALGALRITDRFPDTDLDAAIETTTALWAENKELRVSRLPAVRAEAERLRADGLWEGRYRNTYEQALRHLRESGEPGGTVDPEQALVTAITDGLGHSLFERCLTAAPGLCHRLVPR